MRNYSSTAVATTLASAITSSDTAMTLTAATGLPTVPFTLVLAPDTANEEIVTVTARSGTSVTTMSRAQESTTARSHAAGVAIKHMITGRDLQDAQDHIANTTTAHGVTGAVVGTTNSQTLTNKAISGSANTLTNIAQASVTNLVTDLAAKAPAASPTFTGTVVLPSTTSIGNVTSTEIGYIDGVTSAIQTQLDAKSPLAGPTFTGTATVANLTATGTVSLPSTTSIGSVDSTELGYLNGVTSNVQTQLDAKASATGTYAYLTNTTSMTSSGVLTFGAESYDSSNGHDNTTNPSRFTATVAGYYFVAYCINFTTADSSGSSFSIRKNGSTVTGTVASVDVNVSGVEIPIHLTALVYLNGSTDYVEAYGSISSGTIGQRNATIFKISN